jgi:hypothetical protein
VKPELASTNHFDRCTKDRASNKLYQYSDRAILRFRLAPNNVFANHRATNSIAMIFTFNPEERIEGVCQLSQSVVSGWNLNGDPFLPTLGS